MFTNAGKELGIHYVMNMHMNASRNHTEKLIEIKGLNANQSNGKELHVYTAKLCNYCSFLHALSIFDNF